MKTDSSNWGKVGVPNPLRPNVKDRLQTKALRHGAAAKPQDPSHLLGLWTSCSDAWGVSSCCNRARFPGQLTLSSNQIYTALHSLFLQSFWKFDSSLYHLPIYAALCKYIMLWMPLEQTFKWYCKWCCWLVTGGSFVILVVTPTIWTIPSLFYPSWNMEQFNHKFITGNAITFSLTALKQRQCNNRE